MSDKEINYLDSIRASAYVRNQDPRRGDSGGPGAGGLPWDRRQQVIRTAEVTGQRPVWTLVNWIRPSDGEHVRLIVDLFGVQNGQGRIPDELIHSVLILCPVCTPNAPLKGPGSEKGQILVRGCDVGAYQEEYPRWDENLRQHYYPLHLNERLRCPFLCGWHVQIKSGHAENVRGVRNLWSKIAW